jgi:hypothetical protein
MYFISFLIESPETAGIIKESLPEIETSLKEYEQLRDSWTFLHYLRSRSVQGTFRVAKNVNYNGQKDSNSTITTDGFYLYVIIRSKIYRYWFAKDREDICIR